jgi:hypothetical protein
MKAYTYLGVCFGIPQDATQTLLNQSAAQAEPSTAGEGVPGAVPLGNAAPPTPEPLSPKRSPAHYLWAVLIARIYEVFPLLCPMCGGQMRLIALIKERAQIMKILDHIGAACEPLRIPPRESMRTAS